MCVFSWYGLLFLLMDSFTPWPRAELSMFVSVFIELLFQFYWQWCVCSPIRLSFSKNYVLIFRLNSFARHWPNAASKINILINTLTRMIVVWLCCVKDKDEYDSHLVETHNLFITKWISAVYHCLGAKDIITNVLASINLCFSWIKFFKIY